jgi:diaminohydroxyphosphoribosylaminopyrimidine deaminase/5-amino-6-(5-phosphoribosylamino)uracil reductase
MTSETFPDAAHMREALRLARRGAGRTSPNPAVGAVVVRAGRVVGRGYHKAAGMPHAEVEALRDAGDAARGSDLYVTLEPCDHRGRTGPCTGAILEAGIARVAYAMEDPNPRVSGRGARRLREAGLSVHAGLLADEAAEINRGYCRWIVSGRPFVTLKLAMSLDGQIAAATGESRWVTGEAARAAVHRMRSLSDAVLVGGETVRRDDPLLTSRIRGGRDPKRIVLTSRPGAIVRNRLFEGKGGGILVVCPERVPKRETDAVRALGARVLRLPSRAGRIRADALLDALGGEGITSLLVEGGGKTAGWLTDEGAVDRYVAFVAPLLLGEGIRAISGWACHAPSQGRRLAFTAFRRVGADILLIAEPAGPLAR